MYQPKAYTLRSAHSDLRYFLGSGRSLHGLGSIFDIKGFPHEQVSAEEGTMYVPTTADAQAFDRAAKHVLGWREHHDPVWAEYSPSQYACRAVIITDEPHSHFQDATFLFRGKEKTDDDSEAWQVKYTRLNNVSISVATDADVNSLSGSSDSLEKTLIETYAGATSIKASSIDLSAHDPAVQSTMMMSPHTSQVFTLTQGACEQGIGAVVAMRSRSNASGTESSRWNVVYLKEDKAESGSAT